MNNPHNEATKPESSHTILRRRSRDPIVHSNSFCTENVARMAMYLSLLARPPQSERESHLIFLPPLIACVKSRIRGLLKLG